MGFLHLFKSLPVNNGLVSVFYNEPFFFGDSLLNMDFVAFNALAALYHIPHINAMFQDRVYGDGAPHGIALGIGGIVLEPLLLLIGCGTKCPVVVQIVGDPALVHAGKEHGKDAFYYLGGLGID